MDRTLVKTITVTAACYYAGVFVGWILWGRKDNG